MTIVIAGCASVPTPRPTSPAPTVPSPAATYTHGASTERTPQYFRCVSEVALPMAMAPASPAAIARYAAARCDTMRQAIIAALEEENDGKPLSHDYASVFGEALQTRVIHHVAGLVREARRK